MPADDLFIHQLDRRHLQIERIDFEQRNAEIFRRHLGDGGAVEFLAFDQLRDEGGFLAERLRLNALGVGRAQEVVAHQPQRQATQIRRCACGCHGGEIR